MAWIARDKDGSLSVYEYKPERAKVIWIQEYSEVNLPSDADVKLIGRHISWEDEPVEI